MAQRIQLRRGTAAEWAAANPVLALGEPGVETDTGKQKFGNGTANWSALPYAATKGEPGRDGSNVLPTDTAIKNAITTPGTETATALSATILDVGNRNYASQKVFDGTTTAAEITAWLAAPSALGVKRSIGSATISDPVVLSSNLNWDATGTTLTLNAASAKSMLTNDWTNGNTNVKVNGLTLNANRTTDSDPRNPASWHTIYLQKITGLTLDNVTVLWPLAFGGLITACKDIYLTNYRTHSEHINQDGIHFFDCEDVTIDGLHGTAGDDLLGISAQYADVRNFTVSNVVGTSKHASLIRVNQTDRSVAAAETRTIESLHFDGIIGYDCRNKGLSINNVHANSTVRDIQFKGTFYRTSRSGIDIVKATESTFDVTLIDCGTGVGITDFLTQQPIYVATSLTKSTIRARIIGVTDGFDAIKINAGSDLEIIPRITYPTAGKASPQMGVWLGNVTDSVVRDGYVDGANRGVQVGTSTTTAQRVRVTNMLIKNNTGAAIQEGSTSDNNWFHDNEIITNTIGKVGANTRVERNRGYRTENRGVATIASAGTSITVTHGLSATPTVVTLTGRSTETVGAYVNTINAAQFQIVVPTATTAAREVMWEARV